MIVICCGLLSRSEKIEFLPHFSPPSTRFCLRQIYLRHQFAVTSLSLQLDGLLAFSLHTTADCGLYKSLTFEVKAGAGSALACKAEKRGGGNHK
jgi:hypothetical protein